MAGRRQPLSNISNAVNSPIRNIAAGNGKRTRAQAGEHRDAAYSQPPAKKQAIEIKGEDAENLDPIRRGCTTAPAPDKADEFFSRRAAGPETPFQRRLAAAREKKPATLPRPEPPQKQSADNIESVRQWKRHYKRQFPSFVFYFESVPEDVRTRTTRQFQSLGAREEKFFSKAVTHVITTRSIPPELVNTSPEDDVRYDSVEPKATQPTALTHDQRRTTSLLDANLQRRTQSQSANILHDIDTRKPQVNNADILSRARALGIKIWALEKVQRVLRTMLETETDDPVATNDIRSHVTISKATTRPSKDADLELLLRNEKINGPADRDMTVAAQDMVALKGFYVYIHDMDEKTKPVMVRDYAKPTTKEQGKWPQFRLTPIGRCPFVEDPAHTKKLQQQEREAQRIDEQRQTRALVEREANLRRSPRKATQQTKPELAKPLAPPKQIPAKRQSSAEGMPPLFGSAQQSLRGLPRMIGGEPVASGLQHSNVTSAIRSQAISSAAISSTAAGVNKRVADSKEVSALKRKVLERGNSTTSNLGMPTSYMNDVRAALNDDANPPPRAAKRKAQETLGVLHEDDEDNADSIRPTHRRPAPRKRKPVQKEAKPGYCENCRDKFDDFDDVRPPTTL